jgi:hypothetical protein
MGLSASAMAGQATEIIPYWVKASGAVILIGLSIKPIFNSIKKWNFRKDAKSSFSKYDFKSSQTLPMAGSKEEKCKCPKST